MGTEEIIKTLLNSAGVKVNDQGDSDIQVHHPDFYKRVIRDGALGFGESYMDGWWDVKKMDELSYRLQNAFLGDKIKSLNTLVHYWEALVVNMGKKSKAFEVGIKHYDLGNDLFENMLGKRMAYSCGYWKEAQNLDEAQEAKLSLICRKLNLKPGMKVLDIGCGWGSFCKYAAENYDVEVVGITVSKEQIDYATTDCKGLNVQFKLMDYRDLNNNSVFGKEILFDRIVSVGMFEHVGYKNYSTFMNTVNKLLKENGLFLLHTIGVNKSVVTSDPWTNKYIFPNSHVPSIKQIGGAIENIFVMEDWHSFGTHYDKTLLAWFENFDRNWELIKSKYNEHFYRMWKYYLLSSAGSFRVRNIQLWQIILSKKGDSQDYISIR
ncbi:MAG TPA: cyclopropane fatty acyl phospholipid synthase [Paludibacter sp.]